MGGHRQSTNIRSSIKARGPPGPIHSIQQQPPSVPPTNVVDNGHDRMVMKITSGGGSRSGSPTPRNSPKSTHQILEEYQLQPHQVTFFRTKAFYELTRFIKKSNITFIYSLRIILLYKGYESCWQSTVFQQWAASSAASSPLIISPSLCAFYSYQTSNKSSS